MAVLATENFTGTNGTFPANWTADGLLGIVSNACGTLVANYFCTEGYDGITWPANHYAQAKILTLPSVQAGVVVRRQDYSTFYAAGTDINDFADHRCVIWRYNAEAITLLGDAPGEIIAVNDIVYLEVVGTTLTMKVNGVQKIQLTDSSIASAGRPGLEIYHSSTAVGVWDDWEGGDFAAVGGHPTQRRFGLVTYGRSMAIGAEGQKVF